MAIGYIQNFYIKNTTNYTQNTQIIKKKNIYGIYEEFE